MFFKNVFLQPKSKNAEMEQGWNSEFNRVSEKPPETSDKYLMGLSRSSLSKDSQDLSKIIKETVELMNQIRMWISRKNLTSIILWQGECPGIALRHYCYIIKLSPTLWFSSVPEILQRVYIPSRRMLKTSLCK